MSKPAMTVLAIIAAGVIATASPAAAGTAWTPAPAVTSATSIGLAAKLSGRQPVNATTFSFKGQCTKRSDCGAGTWSCCNTSCEPVAKCR